MSAASDCPCGSRVPYGRCCEPLHRGLREAPDAGGLMRSRYAAFARKDVEYLWRTLHPDHPDRARPKPAVIASLRRSAEAHRYMGLAVLDQQAPDADGIARVLFLARVFTRGRDLSFVECSDFARDGDGWRYLSGVGGAASDLRDALDGLTIARFRELLARG